MADGTQRPISQVAEGELVAATDPLTGITTAEPVVNVISGLGDKELVQLSILGSDRPVTATSNHPIWVDGRGWTQATDVGIDDRIVQADGSTARIRDVRHLGLVGNSLVYNLTVDGPHTFTVASGSSSMVVHNSSCKLSGVYVLTFADGSKYVGRSVNLSKRVATHQRTFAKKGQQFEVQIAHYFRPGTTRKVMRMREQAYINLYNTGSRGQLRGLVNSRHEIAPKYWKRRR